MIFGEHRLRLITGGILALVLALCVWYGGLPLLLLTLAVVLVGLFEFYSLFWPGTERAVTKLTGLILGAGLLLAQGSDPLWTHAVLLLYGFAAALLFLFAYGRGETETRLSDYMPLIFGAVYIVLAMRAALVFSPAEQLLCVLAAIGTDVGGYYAGCRFGKNKVWPSVSPKKSWEGSAGGLALCVVLCLGFGLARERFALNLPDLPLAVWVLVGIFLNIAAQMGDFFESALKRTLNVKDSGTILPGHGGLLDRIDSLLFVLPAYLLVRQLVG